jgi:predicted nucleic acid-binding protein
MPAFVADASLCLAWCFPGEDTPATESLLRRAESGEEIAVPAHWPVEVLNAVIQGQKRGRVSEVFATGFLARLFSFALAIDDSGDLSRLKSVRDLAERHKLTAYDAAYLELALRLGLPLATLDGDLQKSARAENIPLL